MADVSFSFVDLSTGNISTEVQPTVKITPYYFPVNYSGSIMTGDPFSAPLDSNSSVIITGVIPNVYNVSVIGFKKETSFLILVPETGSINAADYILENFTGSIVSSGVKIVPAPPTTSSFGQEGWMAISGSFLYVYTGGLWERTVLAFF